MKTHVHRSVIHGAMLSTILLIATPAHAGWFCGFDNEEIPDWFVINGWDRNGQPTTDTTLSRSASGGFLTLSDATSQDQGGTVAAAGGGLEVFTDVRVTATINVTEDTDDFLALWARADWPHSSRNYYTGLCLGSQWGAENVGRLAVAKSVGFYEVVGHTYSTGRVADVGRSYFIELEVVDDPVTGFPTISGSLFDSAQAAAAGDAPLLMASFTDDGIGGPPLASGISAVGTIEANWGQRWINATFDDVASVPEPSTLLLLIVAAVPTVAYSWRHRRQTELR